MQQASLQPALGVHREASRAPAVALDLAAVVLCFGLAAVLRSSAWLDPVWTVFGTTAATGTITWDRNELALLLFQGFTIPTLLYATGQYRLIKDPEGTWSFNRILASVGASFGALFVLLFVLGIQGVPRILTGMDFVFLTWALVGWRAAYEYRARDRLAKGIGLRHVLLFGTTPLTAAVGDHIIREPRSGRRVLGFISQDGSPLPVGADGPRADVATAEFLSVSESAALIASENPRHLRAAIEARNEEEITQALDGLGIEEVFVGPSATDATRTILQACQARGVDVHLIPDHHAELGIRPQAWSLGPYTLLDVHRRPISRLGAAAKRGMDVLGGLVGLLVFSPVIAITAVALKLENPREPVFYPGTRVGLKGRHFPMAKFTTMRPDAQEIEKAMETENQRDGPWFKLEATHDPRLTKVGRFIRKFSINEIPQFWNVLKGDMSLVGPRPPIPDEVARYVDYDFRYFRCLDVRPGITGLWQVTCKNDPSFDRRIDLDIKYIETWTLWLDLKILFKTLWTVVAEPEE